MRLRRATTTLAETERPFVVLPWSPHCGHVFLCVIDGLDCYVRGICARLETRVVIRVGEVHLIPLYGHRQTSGTCGIDHCKIDLELKGGTFRARLGVDHRIIKRGIRVVETFRAQFNFFTEEDDIEVVVLDCFVKGIDARGCDGDRMEVLIILTCRDKEKLVMIVHKRQTKRKEERQEEGYKLGGDFTANKNMSRGGRDERTITSDIASFDLARS